MKHKQIKYLTCVLALTFLLSACGTDSTDNSGKNTADTSASAEENTDSPSDTSSEAESPAGQESTNPDDLPGILSTFTATDLDGNEVDQSILADSKLTMVNVWATYCGPCLREMPDLGELAAEYEEKGVRIVGLVSDTLDSNAAIDESQVAVAKEIVEKTKADYLHILPSTDLFGLLSQISAVPTTFFVDETGKQVGSTYVQAMEKEQWREVIDSVLSEVNE